MERLTNKREADAQREEYERRLANGYPRNIPEERFLRLAAYEDTRLTPERCAEFARADAEGRYIVMRDAKQEGVARLRELAEADKDGRLVVLPCKVGDTVWSSLDGAKCARECKVDFVNIGNVGTTFVLSAKNGLREQYGVTAVAFGKTVFLTHEEAEKALEAEKNE